MAKRQMVAWWPGGVFYKYCLMNNNTKEQYCSPECGLVELKMEGALICTSPGLYPGWGGENI